MLPRPTARCSVKDVRGIDTEYEGGYFWLGAPLSKAEVLKRYPERRLENPLACKDAAAREKLAEQHRREFERSSNQSAYHPTAVAHFAGFWADEQEDGKGDFEHVYVGDYVKISMEDDNTKGWSIAQVEELYQTPAGKRMMKVRWFYAAHDRDTSLIYRKAGKKAAPPKKRGKKAGAEEDGGEQEEQDEDEDEAQQEARLQGKGVQHLMAVEDFDERQVFRARDNALYPHEYDINNLECKVEVVYVQPDEEPPEDCEFWWTFEFDRRFFSFEVPLDVAEQQRQQFEASRTKNTPLVLRGMDLYVGAGGLGYLDHVSLLEDGKPDPKGVQTRTDWACDYEADMAHTFKANNSHTHVFMSGTDELLELCKATYELYEELKMDAPGQPVRPWNGCTPYERCDDDRMVAWPRCVQFEVVARTNKEGQAKKSRGRKPANKQAAAKRRKLASGAAAAAAAGLLEDDETEQGGSEAGAEEAEAEESETEEVTEEEEKRYADDEDAGSTGDDTGKDGSKRKIVITEEDCLPYRGELGTPLEIKQVRLGECAPHWHSKDVAAGLLMRDICKEERWLEFKVLMETKEGTQEEVWLSRKQLEGQDGLLRGFVRKLREHQCIPFPGEVDFICGGPPCQGISGNNRHAKTEDILKDPRNRQLSVFINYVDWFKPKYVLMENVQDILKKEDGLYIKYAMGSMLNMRYQVRVGLLAAGNFGVPQGRWRCFMWAAGPGQQLPAIPKPSHNCLHFKTPIASTAKRCTAGFCGRAEAEEGYPPILLGDILSDLPPVDNTELHERQLYLTPPQRVTQAWLRRPPQPWMTSVEERLKAHEEYMHEGHVALVRAALEAAERGSLTSMGNKCLLNQKNPLHPQLAKDGTNKKRSSDNEDAGNHAFETLSAALRGVGDPKLQVALWLQAEASRAGYAHMMAEKYKPRLLQYLEEFPSRRVNPDAVLCDHRPYHCNADDLQRLAAVPKRNPGDEEHNFRSLEGIAENEDGTCCYGHSHAPKLPKGSACLGGGAFEPPTRKKKGVVKDYRVDHHNKEGWRGGALHGCPAYSVFMPTGDPLVPQWCVTFKGGRSQGRGGCYGRVAETEIVSTVVGRAEPHNLKVAHPYQDRILTIRENARTQGFPDYHVLLAKPNTGTKRIIRNPNLTQRYQQMGNAVSPQVAAALGRCLALAALHRSPPGEMLLSVPDVEYVKLAEEWEGLEDADELDFQGFYATEYGAEKLEMLDNIVNFIKTGSRQDGSGGSHSDQQPTSAGPGSKGESEEEEEEDAPSPQQKAKAQRRPRSRQAAQPAVRGAKKKQQVAMEVDEEEEEEEEEEQQRQQQKDDEGGSSSGSEEEEEEDEQAGSEEEEKVVQAGSEEEEDAEEGGSGGATATAEEQGQQEDEKVEESEEEEEEEEEEDSDEQFEDAQESEEEEEGSETEASEDEDGAPVQQPLRKIARV